MTLSRLSLWPRERIAAHVLRSVLSYFLIACVVVLALLAIGQLTQILQQVASGQLPLQVVLQLLGLSVPTLLVTVLPLALFFAVYLVFSNLYRHNEMMAIHGAGIGLQKLFWGLLPSVFLLVLLEAGLALWWAPSSQQRLQDESARLAAAAAQALIHPGSFAHLPDGRVIYVGQGAGAKDRYQEIFIDLSQVGAPDYATAAFGEIQINHHGGVSLLLIDGRRYLGQPGQAGYKIWSFARYRVDLAAPRSEGSATSWTALSLPDLFARLGRPDQHAHALAELEWRIFWPLFLPIVVLLAVPLAYAEPRHPGRAGGVLLGILLLLGANNLLVALKENLIQGKIPPFPGLFWTWILLAGLATYLFYRRQADLPLLPAWMRGVAS
ncbi:LPS export ABC transporter permease LptF [Acidithiobacillus sp. CV18-2]|uniref:Lipopolysaccharide export system permease protein LptF n=1 Tax=Igneacidithiobacillus copahuensis TaxID=2724909 RepID=A0AAE2YRR5_9PROT|nr:LPS export ABC transporter permease LptF [Igneacidithiobacillus copahuensis]MBU2753410.1 LPS export ABC transporter permease LptF [Acidithiobacillus sp. CV18-3]MBU2756440.1 LPS export ABC transporter permease LptF [Acidithiobacillus sp. BN09-2]MBU2776227.1 LPS export ABC transporter permease LptF [Acidithiobacillus sp. CV18-2]MBU2795645.1 LPS export ABC transporter permease LptF [Acidithiobacillus sp. VAN18-2]MBU2798355.1 LPS export ABC transporter permease LptF [Acidithiobacillus sp. VAN18